MSTNALDPVRQALAGPIHQALLAQVPKGQSLGLSEDDIGRLLEKPKEMKMGDFALPCFRFAKPLGKKPAEVAEMIAAATSGTSEWIDSVQVASAFLNIFINQKKLAALLLPKLDSGAWFHRASSPERKSTRVMIEYSQPNTHKEFHVGHARNVCLGNAMVRLFRHLGYDVLSVNYFGDEGTHIAKCLWYINKTGAKAPPEGRGVWLGEQYVAANHALAEASDDKAAIEQDISSILAAIESKEGPIYDQWCETRQWSLDDFAKIYEWFHVEFDELFYESQVSLQSQALVDEYLDKGIFVEDDGAVGVDLKPYKLGFMIARKRDGNTLYATKDLALAQLKFGHYKIDRSIYVVASEQNHHFRQVFKTLELMGFPQAGQCFHLSYGMVVLPEGRMSSRSGNSVKFLGMRDEILTKLGEHLQKYEQEWSPEQIAETAHQLAEGAIKYGMLSTDPTKEIVYILDDWLSFEGNSGPYLMYSYTRTQSILDKAKAQGLRPDASQTQAILGSPERELMRYLYDFNEVIESAAEQYKPSLLLNQLYYMCKAFNRFYAETSVLNADTAAQKAIRLSLVDAFAKTLRLGLDLVGITPPTRM